MAAPREAWSRLESVEASSMISTLRFLNGLWPVLISATIEATVRVWVAHDSASTSAAAPVTVTPIGWNPATSQARQAKTCGLPRSGRTNAKAELMPRRNEMLNERCLIGPKLVAGAVLPQDRFSLLFENCSGTRGPPSLTRLPVTPPLFQLDTEECIHSSA